MATVAVEGITNGNAVMGNEASRIEIKQDIGDVEKPGQFHRVLVDPDYSEIEAPILTKVSVTAGLEAVPQVQTSATEGSVDEKVPAENGPTEPKLNGSETDENKINAIAKEIVDNAVTTAVAKANGEAETTVTDATVTDTKDTVTESKDIVTDSTVTETKATTIPNGKIEPSEHTIDDVLVSVDNIGVAIDDKEKQVTDVKDVANDTVIKSGVEEAVTSNVDISVTGDSCLESSIESQDSKDLVQNLPQISGESLPPVTADALSKDSVEESVSENSTPEKIKKKDKSKDKSKKKKVEQNKRERELIESVKDELSETKSESPEKKSGKGKGFMKMFKFSKNKPNTVNEASSNNVEENVEKQTTIEHLNDKSATLQIEKSPVIANASVSHVENNQINGDIQASAIQNGQSYNKDIMEIDSKASGVKRMNSLDSGIVVEKVSELQPDQREIDVSVKPHSENEIQASANSNADVHVDKSNIEKALSHVNGDEVKEVVTNFNERGVDIGEIKANADTKEITQETKEILLDGKDKLNTPHAEQPAVAHTAQLPTGDDKDSVTSDQTTESDEKPKTVKIKKKSWSFQIGGSKKKVEGQEATEEGKDKTKDGREVKKPRWRLGKLSFRRQHSDVSASTPNLTQTGIPEEDGTDQTENKKGDKKKNKLKKIKAKKEQKKEAKKREEEARSSRSNSMLEMVLGDSNRPGSRRSIVEEDTPYTTTDAFEGVDLADLSADEDVQVSKDPAGTEAKPETKTGFAAKAIGFFKSDKKKSPSSPTGKDKPKSMDNLNIIEDGEYAQIRPDQVAEFETKPSKSPEGKKITSTEHIVVAATGVRDSTGALYAQVVKQEKEDESSSLVEHKEEGKHAVDSSMVDSAVYIAEITDVSVNESFAMPDQPLLGKEEIVSSDVTQHGAELSFTDQVLKSADDVMKSEVQIQDTDSDAYVQLEDIVTDNKPEINVTEIKPELLIKQEELPKASLNNITDSGEHIVDNIIESDKTVEDNVVDSGNDSSGDINTEGITQYCSETKIELVQPMCVSPTFAAPAIKKAGRSRVVIMKEVGVQAPDIHMPLDIEKDFGFSSENLPTVSIGVQVSDGTTQEEHTDGRKMSQGSQNVSPAYF